MTDRTTINGAPTPANPPLKFLARGTGMVPNYEALMGSGRLRAFHGWTHDATLGGANVDFDVRGVPMSSSGNQGAFVKQLGKVIEIPFASPYRGEYLRHLRDGDLWPVDVYTAQLAGIKHDPKFGGEHADDVKAAQAEELKALRDAAVKPVEKPNPNEIAAAATKRDPGPAPSPAVTK
jgi:hypothetical protein